MSLFGSTNLLSLFFPIIIIGSYDSHKYFTSHCCMRNDQPRFLTQVRNSHIILTGAMALNKLLGREVYTSNSQLGGVQVCLTLQDAVHCPFI